MRNQKNIDVYVIGTKYCPHCKYFNDMDKCKLDIKKHKGLGYCTNYKEE